MMISDSILPPHTIARKLSVCITGRGLVNAKLVILARNIMHQQVRCMQLCCVHIELVVCFLVMLTTLHVSVCCEHLD